MPLSSSCCWIFHHFILGSFLIATVSIVGTLYSGVPEIEIVNDNNVLDHFLPNKQFPTGYRPIKSCPPINTSQSSLCNEFMGYATTFKDFRFHLVQTKDYVSLLRGPSGNDVVGVPWSRLTYEVVCNNTSSIYYNFTAKIKPNICPSSKNPKDFNPPWAATREEAITSAGYSYAFCVAAVVLTLFSFTIVPILKLCYTSDNNDKPFGLSDGYLHDDFQESHVILIFTWSLSAIMLAISCICGWYAKQSTHDAYSVPRLLAQGEIATLPVFRNVSIFFTGSDSRSKGAYRVAVFGATILDDDIIELPPYSFSKSDVVADLNAQGSNTELQTIAFSMLSISAILLAITVLIWSNFALPERIFHDRIKRAEYSVME
jgi:hypothetical protein